MSIGGHGSDHYDPLDDQAIVGVMNSFQNRPLELVEIPVTLFAQVLKVGKVHFVADGPTINIPLGKDPPDFTSTGFPSQCRVSEWMNSVSGETAWWARCTRWS